MKLDNEIVELKNGTRYASRPVRGEATRPGRKASRSSSSPRRVCEDQREDVDGQRDWWAD